MTRSLTGAAVAFVGLVGLSLPATAASVDDPPMTINASCGSVFNVSVGKPTNQATAHWELTCKDGKVKVAGWVKDTSADGQCAKVKAVFQGQVTEFSDAACPKNVKKNFSWSHPGSIADVYLFTYDV